MAYNLTWITLLDLTPVTNLDSVSYSTAAKQQAVGYQGCRKQSSHSNSKARILKHITYGIFSWVSGHYGRRLHGLKSPLENVCFVLETDPLFSLIIVLPVIDCVADISAVRLTFCFCCHCVISFRVDKECQLTRL